MLTGLYHRLRGLRRGANFERAFLTRRQFAREISRERIRASRRGIPFCVASIIIEGDHHPTRSTQAGRLILRNLRVTDEKAMLSRSEFAVLLVDTPQAGGRAVIERLSQLFATKQLRVHMELKVHDPAAGDHPDRPDAGPPTSNHSGSVYAEPMAGRQSAEWAAPAPPQTVVVGAVEAVDASHETRDWSAQQPVAELQQQAEQSQWQSSASRLADRRAVQSLQGSPALPAQADELVSSEDPLIEPIAFSGALKRGVDIFGALLGLVLVGPLLLITMALIRLTSPGGAIFRQTREGLRGRPFTIYKLRTMVADAESSQCALRDLSHRDGPAFKIKSDPRVTPVGRLLRATCIDELPQLVNVLYGDMSLVGPRPLPWHESRACSHWQRRRLDVRPGLTCFWQVNKSSVTSFDEWMRLDLGYVDRGSLWTDLRLIYQTLSVAITGRGSH
ncbi:MAG: sugar transferase [Planctomycetaceae bacterium]